MMKCNERALPRVLIYMLNAKCIVKKASMAEMQSSRKSLVPLPDPKTNDVAHGQRSSKCWSLELTTSQDACPG
eukprot:scaffold410656_cov52-Prasinocladus_malaysianus.AAC.1